MSKFREWWQNTSKLRQRCLALEKKQVIKELKLLQEHIEELDAEICTIVQHAREGKILLSLGIIGPIQAAMIIAAIGNVLNFPRAATLKSYFGWAPKREQTVGPMIEATSATQEPGP
jgi:transposase